MTDFTFGNPATVSLAEATRRQAVDILKGLAERLDVATEPSREVDELLARYLTKDYAIDYTSSVDSALALVTRLYPSLVIVMCRCSDGIIQIREAWDAEDDSVEVGAVREGVGGLPVLRCLVAAMIKRVEAAHALP